MSSSRHSHNPIVPYERQLDQNLELAMSEGSLFFEGRGKVHETLRRITKRLNELGIPYAVAGGMALLLHGYRRFTEDVDILVTPEGLRRIHQELEGRGYLRRFETSKNLRDTDSNVKIEFLLTGSYPGDGKPKEIAFPNPDDVAETRGGIRVLGIPSLVSLKLASGMTGEGRGKDFGDVEELVKLLDLPESLANALHPSVREKYIEIWRKLHVKPKRYLALWRNKWLTSEAKTLSEMVDMLRDAAATLEQMRADGVTLEPDGGTSDDYAYLITTDRAIAEKYGMEEESEFWGYDGEDDEPDGTQAGPSDRDETDG